MPSTTAISHIDLDDDQAVCAALISTSAAPIELAQGLFYRHFQRLERVIRQRLASVGLSYDAGAEHYNEVLEKLYQQVFAPTRLPGAVSGFDPSKGTLERWLLQRADFVLRDWVKSRRRKIGRVVSAPVEEIAAAASSEAALGPSEILDRALSTMTARQRACTVLRLLPGRPPNPADQQAISEVSKRSETEIDEELKTFPADLDAKLGQREQEILDELARCSAVQQSRRWLTEMLRRQLRDLGLSEQHLEQLETAAASLSQQEIGQRFAIDAKGQQRDVAPLQLRFAQGIRDLARYTARMEKLQQDYKALQAAPLLSYQQISSILGMSVDAVTAQLHSAKKILAKVWNSSKEREDSPLT